MRVQDIIDARGTTYHWAGGDGDWNTASLWQPNGIPVDGDTAVFDTGGVPYTVTGDASVAGIVVNSDLVTFDGQLFQTSGVATPFLTATGGASVTLDSNAFALGAGLDFSAGSLLDVNGTLIDTGGTADVAIVDGIGANWTNGAAVTLNQLYVQDSGTYAGNAVINNGGSVTLDTSASLSGGTLAFRANGTLFAADGGGTGAGAYGTTEAITTGAVGSPAGSAVAISADSGFTFVLSGDISGAGLIDIDGGTILLAGANTYTGGTVVDGSQLAASLVVQGGGGAGTGPVFLENGTLATIADSTGSVNFAETVVGASGSDTVYAVAGNLAVLAGSATDFSFVGGEGHSTVVGGTGALLAVGGSAGDVIFGGTSGQDMLYTGKNSAILAGGVGGSLFAVGGGNSTLAAGSGNTTLQGGSSTGDNAYFGSATGSTTIQVGTGDSTVVGTGGSDTILGNTGTDNVFAGSGAEQLDFASFSGGGTTNVFGFNAANDHLQLLGYADGEAQAAIGGALVAGGSTELTLSDNTHIIFWGTTGLTSGIFT